MKTGRLFFLAALAGVTLLGSAASSRAQDDPPRGHAKVVIKGPNGTQEFELDPSQLPPLGEGSQVAIMRVGPDGQVFTFAGSPDSLGMFMGPNGLMLGGPGGPGMPGLDIVDPGRTYIHQLIKRDDVRTELLITAQQREAMEGWEKNQQEARRQALQGFQALTGDLKGKSPEEIRAQMTENAQRLREQMQSAADEQDKRLAALLTLKQMTRLKELDMQWRGALALGVKPVAELAKLTVEQQPKVTDLLREYRQKVSRHLNAGFRTASFTQKAGAGTPPGEVNAPASTPEEMQARMEKARLEIEKSRKILGEKALKGLTDIQRAQWSSLTGRPFRFRTTN